MTEQTDHVAARADLGDLVSSWTPPTQEKWADRSGGERAGLVLGLTIGFGFVALVLLGITLLAPTVGIVLIAVALVIGGVCWWALATSTDPAVGRQLRLYERGLIVVGMKGETHDAYRWDSMTVLQDITRHYRNGVYTRTTHAYTLSGPGTREIRLTDGLGITSFPDAERWGVAIQERVTRAQLPAAVAELRRGGTLTFGPLQVGARELTAGGRSVAWTQVEELKVDNGQVSVRVENRWRNLAKEPVSRIPNFFVFRALAEQLRTGGR